MILLLLLLAPVPFLVATLNYIFARATRLLYLAAPVVALITGAEASVKYHASTGPPELTEILQIIQILQIVQTESRLIFTDHADHTDSTHVDHTDPVDHKHMLRVIHIQPGKDVQMTQIPRRYSPGKYPPHTGPSRLNKIQASVKYPDAYRSS